MSSAIRRATKAASRSASLLTLPAERPGPRLPVHTFARFSGVPNVEHGHLSQRAQALPRPYRVPNERPSSQLKRWHTGNSHRPGSEPKDPPRDDRLKDYLRTDWVILLALVAVYLYVESSQPFLCWAVEPWTTAQLRLGRWWWETTNRAKITRSLRAVAASPLFSDDADALSRQLERAVDIIDQRGLSQHEFRLLQQLPDCDPVTLMALLGLIDGSTDLDVFFAALRDAASRDRAERPAVVLARTFRDRISELQSADWAAFAAATGGASWDLAAAAAEPEPQIAERAEPPSVHVGQH